MASGPENKETGPAGKAGGLRVWGYISLRFDSPFISSLTVSQVIFVRSFGSWCSYSMTVPQATIVLFIRSFYFLFPVCLFILSPSFFHIFCS